MLSMSSTENYTVTGSLSFKVIIFAIYSLMYLLSVFFYASLNFSWF